GLVRLDFRGLGSFGGLLGGSLGVTQRLVVDLLGEGGRGREGGGDQGGEKNIALGHCRVSRIKVDQSIALLYRLMPDISEAAVIFFQRQGAPYRPTPCSPLNNKLLTLHL